MEGPGGPGREESGPRDTVLIESYRSGNLDAAGALFERHRKAALGYARHLAGQSDAEDVASEAFLKTLRAIEAGKGPTSNFRSYLLTTVHNTYVSLVRTDAHFVLQPDFDAAAIEEPDEDEDASLRAIADAFAGLPDRWQTVLWYTLIERRSLEEAAAAMEITPQAVGSLRYRARNGLYEAVLAQLPNRQAECAAVRRLFRQDPDKLTRRNKRVVANHVPDCDQCRRAAKVAPFGAVPTVAIVSGALLGGGYVLFRPAELAVAATFSPAAAGGAGGPTPGPGNGTTPGNGTVPTDGGVSRGALALTGTVVVLVLIIVGVLLSRSQPAAVTEEPPAATTPSSAPSAEPPAEPPSAEPTRNSPPPSATPPPSPEPTTAPPTRSVPPATPPASSSGPATPPRTPPAESSAPRDPGFRSVTVANRTPGAYAITFEPNDASTTTTIDFAISGLRDVRISWGPDIPGMTCAAPVDGKFRCRVSAAVADGAVTVHLRTRASLQGSMTLLDPEQGDADPSNNKITWG